VLAVAPEEVACRRGDAGTWTSQPASVTGSGNSPELATKPTALSGPEERADGRDRCHRASELTAPRPWQSGRMGRGASFRRFARACACAHDCGRNGTPGPWIQRDPRGSQSWRRRPASSSRKVVTVFRVRSTSRWRRDGAQYVSMPRWSPEYRLHPGAPRIHSEQPLGLGGRGLQRPLRATRSGLDGGEVRGGAQRNRGLCSSPGSPCTWRPLSKATVR